MRKSKLGMKGKRVLSMLTAVVMLTAEVATVAGATYIGAKPLNAQADGTEKKIQLGKGSIAKDDLILYGKPASLLDDYESGNGKYRVLDASKDNCDVNGAVFVLSENLWGLGGVNGDVYFDNTDPYSNVWQGSTAQSWCQQFADDCFGNGAPEHNAIKGINKSDAEGIVDGYNNIWWGGRRQYT